ncbi:hypothetical protein ACCO45_012914, partial [Purpureocillium lilacinum]
FDIANSSICIVLEPSLHNTVTMPFHKLVKNSAYFSRYQTKYKRRQQGKTDYYARKRLITQAKNKYNAPKYRLVVRFTNKDIIMQIVTSEITGDKVFASAYAHELKGLRHHPRPDQLGRRLRHRSAHRPPCPEQARPRQGLRRRDRRRRAPPFKAFLDVGLARTSTGARVFGAMKGASDGGILVPHSEKRFPGYDMETKELDAETLRKYIYGGHVAEYMETLADDDEERYQSQFQKYIDDDMEAEGLEDLPSARTPWKKAESDAPKKSKDEWKAESKKFRSQKLSKAEKQERVQKKIKELLADE